MLSLLVSPEDYDIKSLRNVEIVARPYWITSLKTATAARTSTMVMEAVYSFETSKVFLG
jgi:hypothetical protein